MKIAVLGSNGLVGNFLSKSLIGHDVIAINRSQLDLSDYKSTKDFLSQQKFDVVINAAANSDSRMEAGNEIARDNLTSFTNLFACREYIGKVIHFCSGAAYDRKRSLDNIVEDELLSSYPTDAYGLSKNISAKLALDQTNFYTLRLFGVFHKTEKSRRLLPKVLSKELIVLEDRYFDYFYLEDLLPIVEYYIETENPKYKDLNVVYSEKILLSNFVKSFCQIHNIDNSHITIGHRSNLDYTGSGEKLKNLSLSLKGMTYGLQKYND